ncbi:MAG: hypothetical protein PVH42_08370 [Desulfobacterales bacterium]|jgi:hypothetical protein
MTDVPTRILISLIVFIGIFKSKYKGFKVQRFRVSRTVDIAIKIPKYPEYHPISLGEKAYKQDEGKIPLTCDVFFQPRTMNFEPLNLGSPCGPFGGFDGCKELSIRFYITYFF